MHSCNFCLIMNAFSVLPGSEIKILVLGIFGKIAKILGSRDLHFKIGILRSSVLTLGL